MTQDYLKSILTYKPKSGKFYWKVSKAISVKAGDLAGCINDKGYIKICIDSKQYSAHRLAWLYMTGELPIKQIDHINRNRCDNRFNNLRLASNKQNQENVSIRKDNTSGMTGINWSKSHQKWHVRLQHNSKRISLGFFETLEYAIIARKMAELKYYTHKDQP